MSSVICLEDTLWNIFWYGYFVYIYKLLLVRRDSRKFPEINVLNCRNLFHSQKIVIRLEYYFNVEKYVT